MREAAQVIKDEVNLIDKNPHEFDILFDSLKSYAVKNDYFDSTSDAVHELIFNNDIRYATCSRFVLILSYYKLLIEVTYSTGERKLIIQKDLDLLDNLEDFLYLCKNNISIQQYGRVKKLQKIRYGIKY